LTSTLCPDFTVAPSDGLSTRVWVLLIAQGALNVTVGDLPYSPVTLMASVVVEALTGEGVGVAVGVAPTVGVAAAEGDVDGVAESELAPQAEIPTSATSVSSAVQAGRR
jgi:hypothetical protein